MDRSGLRCGILVDDKCMMQPKVLGQGGIREHEGLLDDWQMATSRLAKAVMGKARRTACARQGCNSLHLVSSGAIYCAGANYRDHVDNMARRLNIPPEPDPHELGPSIPGISSSRHGARSAIVRTSLASEFLDWEAELAVVIGRVARNVPLDKVFGYVAGYTLANDLSARDRTQREAVPIASPFRYDWIGQKNFDGACPIGPWIVPQTKSGSAVTCDPDIRKW